MKIAHLLYGLGVGGIECLLVDELRSSSTEHELHLIVLDDFLDQRVLAKIPERVHTHLMRRKLGSGWIGGLLPTLRLNTTLLKISPDVLVLHDIALARLLKVGRFPIVGRIHSTKLWPRRQEYRRLQHAISISRSVDAAVTPLMDPNTSRSIVYNAVPIDGFRVKRDLQLQRPFRIAQVGRIVLHHKAQDIALRALKRCQEKHGFNHWSLDFIGDYEVKSGSLSVYAEDAKRLMTMAQDLGLSDKVHLLGTWDRQRLWDTLCGYDLLIHPARYEGFGLAVAEACAAGVPVLASDVEGPREILGDEEFGFLFPNEDVEQCADKLQYIVSHYTTDLVSSKVNRALDMVKERFHITSMTQQLEEIYRGVCNRSEQPLRNE